MIEFEGNDRYFVHLGNYVERGERPLYGSAEKCWRGL